MTVIEKLEATDSLLTVEALSKLIATSPKTLYKAVASGHLPCYRIGGAIRLEPSEVVEWLRQRHTK